MYSDKEKREALSLVIHCGLKYAQEQTGIPYSTLNSWWIKHKNEVKLSRALIEQEDGETIESLREQIELYRDELKRAQSMINDLIEYNQTLRTALIQIQK